MLLRDREGVTQSGWTAGDHRTADPDQPLNFQVQDFFVFKVDSTADVLLYAGLLPYRSGFLLHECLVGRTVAP